MSSGNIGSNLFNTYISSGLTTGSNSEIPVCDSYGALGGFMVFEDVYGMLNLYQNLRRDGMLVRCMGKGPRNEPEGSYYELQTAGVTVGPSNYIDFLLDETLTIYDKDVLGLTYVDNNNANSDDGTNWIKKDFCCENNNQEKILTYYSGSMNGTDVKLTATEIKTLTPGTDNTIADDYDVGNTSGVEAIPYIALPLSYTDGKYIKNWTISALQTTPTDRWIVKVDDEFYALYRVTGTLPIAGSVNISNFILEDTAIVILGDNQLALDYPIPTTGKYGILLEEGVLLWNPFTDGL